MRLLPVTSTAAVQVCCTLCFGHPDLWNQKKKECPGEKKNVIFTHLKLEIHALPCPSPTIDPCLPAAQSDTGLQICCPLMQRMLRVRLCWFSHFHARCDPLTFQTVSTACNAVAHHALTQRYAPASVCLLSSMLESLVSKFLSRCVSCIFSH